MRPRKNTPVLCLIFLFLSSIQVTYADSIAFYGGPASPTPLITLIRLQVPELMSHWSMNVAYNHPLTTDPNYWAWEIETSGTLYPDTPLNASFQGLTLFRWLATPWGRVFKSSFALGLGLSYAISPPVVEVLILPKTNPWLLHLILEFAFQIGAQPTPWEGLFRVHHRSGAYGLFDGVVGGSDYLCFGVRYHFL